MASLTSVHNGADLRITGRLSQAPHMCTDRKFAGADLHLPDENALISSGLLAWSRIAAEDHKIA